MDEFMHNTDLQFLPNRESLRLYYQSFYDERKYSQITSEFPPKDQYPLYYQAKKIEMTIKEGEMLYIPGGWFHYVFSEEPNPETKLNFAVNFWYINPKFVDNGKSNGEVPKVSKHSIKIDPFELFKDGKDMRFYRSKSLMFPSNRLWRKFSINAETMSFEDFYITKNPEYYLVQTKIDSLNDYAPKIPNKTIHESSVWVNFGGVSSLMHYDTMDNWLCQLQGKKRVILFAPEERSKLYLFNDFPLEFVYGLHTCATSDVFIRRNRTSFDPTKFDIKMAYLREFEKYFVFLVNTECFPYMKREYLMPKFKTIQATDKFDRFTEENNLPFTMLWILSPGELTVRGIHSVLIPGEFVVFPNNMLYPFYIVKARFTYAYI
jgi:Cupin-like domain